MNVSIVTYMNIYPKLHVIYVYICIHEYVCVLMYMCIYICTTHTHTCNNEVEMSPGSKVTLDHFQNSFRISNQEKLCVEAHKKQG